MSEVKQVIVIRKDLHMRRGKEIAQGSHASMAWLTARMRFGFADFGRLAHAYFSPAEKQWIENGFTKIVLYAHTLDELTAVKVKALEAGLEVREITDSGRTEFGGVPTVTCIAIGPDYAEAIDAITRDLPLY